MATNLTFTILITILFLSPIFLPTKSQQFSTILSKREMGLRRQKLSRLRFYFHDIVSGRNPTGMRIAESAVTNSTYSGFGALNMIDDPLTAGPNMSSKIVGRAQGLSGSADLRDVGLFMVFNFAFFEGKFNGSTISVMGRNQVFSRVREMPILGGTGLFRFARGYLQAKTIAFDSKTGNAVVEYNVYVFHY